MVTASYASCLIIEPQVVSEVLSFVVHFYMGPIPSLPEARPAFGILIYGAYPLDRKEAEHPPLSISPAFAFFILLSLSIPFCNGNVMSPNTTLIIAFAAPASPSPPLRATATGFSAHIHRS